MTTFAIISDVHAFMPEPGTEVGLHGDPSWVRTTPNRAEEVRGPFHALESLIVRDELRADYVLCCGDMGDKADPHGVAYTWGWLETLRRRFEAKRVIATTGNHDVDSRNESLRNDPNYIARALQPPYPIDDAALRKEYWDSNVVHYGEGSVDIIVLNTAAHHDTKEDAEQGRVSDVTLDILRTKVEATQRPQRILLAHHHPYRHDALDRNDYSALDGGPEVLRILQDNGNWIVIHGHRHYPNLVYAAGSVQAPVILASGSFSAILYPEMQTRVRNQFHILDLQDAGQEAGTAGLVGTIRSWEYSYSTGWCRPISTEGIPDQAGFGYRGSLEDALEQLQEVVHDSNERFITFEDVVKIHPALRFLLPADRHQLLTLAQGRGVAVAPASNYSMHNCEIFLGRPM